MASQKEVFFLFILIMTQQSSSETDDAVIVHGQGTSCAETVHEVMEDAFADVTSEVIGRNVLQFLEVRPNFILFFQTRSNFTAMHQKMETMEQTIADQNELISNQGDLIATQGKLIERLSATVTRLETQSQQPSVDPEINDRVETLEELSKLRMAPTCEHLAMYGISKSGSYNINLNEDALGAKPVEVHCNFTTMTTEIMPVSRQPVEIEKCSGSGCFTHDVEYLATLSQLEELVDLSIECTQDITFDCNSA